MSTRLSRELAKLQEHMLVPYPSAVSLVIPAVMEDGTTHALMEWRPDRPFEGAWAFPGGKIEPGEVPDGAMVREAAEELGIRVVTAWPLKRFASHTNWTIFPYLVTTYEGGLPPRVLDTGHHLQWLPLAPTERWAWKPNRMSASQAAQVIRRGLEQGT